MATKRRARKSRRKPVKTRRNLLPKLIKRFTRITGKSELQVFNTSTRSTFQKGGGFS